MDLLLPLTIPIPFDTIHDPDLPAGVFRSYARLLSAAHSQGLPRAGPLDFELELLPLLGLSPTQARQHLRHLRESGLLAWTSHGDGRYTLTFPQVGVHSGLSECLSALPECLSALPEEHSGFLESFPEEALDSGNPDSVVVGVDSLLNSLKSLESPQQQTTGSANPEAESELGALVYRCLIRAGVWPGTARDLAAQIVANADPRNATRDYNSCLPDFGDVLGWMAFCFARGSQNGVKNAPALLAANLRLGRRCPDDLRPPRLCGACFQEEDCCDCDEPALGYPVDFIDFALNGAYNAWTQTFWHVCLSCCAYPCLCQQ